MKVYENYVKQECASKRRKVEHDSKNMFLSFDVETDNS